MKTFKEFAIEKGWLIEDLTPGTSGLSPELADNPGIVAGLVGDVKKRVQIAQTQAKTAAAKKPPNAQAGVVTQAAKIINAAGGMN